MHAAGASTGVRYPAAKRRGGNPPFVPDEEQRKLVMMLAASGHTQITAAARLRISVDTLQRHLKGEFDEGRDFANSSVGEVLLRRALKGDVRAIDSWFDRRGGPEWRKRTANELAGPGGGPIRLTAEPPRRDLSHLSEEELEQLEHLTRKLEDGAAAGNC
jgi:hypothetical protein